MSQKKLSQVEATRVGLQWQTPLVGEQEAMYSMAVEDEGKSYILSNHDCFIPFKIFTITFTEKQILHNCSS